MPEAGHIHWAILGYALLGQVSLNQRFPWRSWPAFWKISRTAQYCHKPECNNRCHTHLDDCSYLLCCLVLRVFWSTFVLPWRAWPTEWEVSSTAKDCHKREGHKESHMYFMGRCACGMLLGGSPSWRLRISAGCNYARRQQKSNRCINGRTTPWRGKWHKRSLRH